MSVRRRKGRNRLPDKKKRRQRKTHDGKLTRKKRPIKIGRKGQSKLLRNGKGRQLTTHDVKP